MTNVLYMSSGSMNPKRLTPAYPVTDLDSIDDENALASNVINERVMRPVISSRGNVDKKTDIPIKEYEGLSPGAKDNWLHSLTHEES
jgi:hypothetical protein